MKIDIPLVNENPSDADLHFLEDRNNEYNVETTGISAIQLAIPEFTTSQTTDVAKLGDLNRHCRSEGDQPSTTSASASMSPSAP